MADTLASSGASVATSELSVFAPELTSNNGQITTTSLQVAQHFEKRHADVLRAISKLDCSKEFIERNFALNDFTDSIGRKLPMFHITKDGFMFLAMGFTGKEAAQWKEAYITAFNKMEAELSGKVGQLPTTLTPAQAQHLRELVQLVVESGKQGHGETWARLHRKMKVNSYLALRPDQFDAACEYLRGKMDDASIGALVQKHFPQLPAPAAPAAPALDVKTLCGLILGGIFTGQDFIRLAYAVNQRQFSVACDNRHRGYGEEVASKIKDLSWSDLHIINQKVSMEVWLRSTIPQKETA